jgi:hypothetical protein
VLVLPAHVCRYGRLGRVLVAVRAEQRCTESDPLLTADTASATARGRMALHATGPPHDARFRLPLPGQVLDGKGRHQAESDSHHRKRRDRGTKTGKPTIVRPDPVARRGDRDADTANPDDLDRTRHETVNHSNAPMLGRGQSSHRITPPQPPIWVDMGGMPWGGWVG